MFGVYLLGHMAVFKSYGNEQDRNLAGWAPLRYNE